MKIFLTGANGFLGSRLARALLEQTDHELTLLARPGRITNLPLGERVTVATGDLNNRASLERALDGCGVVIHAAAHVATWARDKSVFDRVNIEGTLNLLRSAGKAGAEKIIYISSFLALGHSDGPPLNEGDPGEREVHYNDYERTKYLANRRALELAGEQGLPLVVLYPTVLYGPGPLTAGNLIAGMIIDFMRRKLPARLGDGKPRWNFVFVEDAVRGVLLALEKAASGKRYILGGEDVSLAGFFGTLEKVAGVRQPRLAVPFPLARLVGAGEELLALLFGRMPQTTRAVIDIFTKNWVFDSGTAAKDLGYKALSLEEGLRRTVEWVRAEGLA